MFHIVYVSTAAGPFSDEDCDDVLASARAFNTAHEVTGLLVCSGGSFLQVLEGPLDAAEQAYARTAASSRHRGLLRTPAIEVPERTFGDWAMGFERAAPTHVVRQLLQPLVDHKVMSSEIVRDVLLARFTSLQHH